MSQPNKKSVLCLAHLKRQSPKPFTYKFIRVVVGDGKKAFFRHDNWLRIGRLIDLTGATGTRYLSVMRNARVHEAVSSGQRIEFLLAIGCEIGAFYKLVFCAERGMRHEITCLFVCLYSYTVWDRLACRLVGRRINSDWQEMFQFIQTGAANQLDQVLIRLVFQLVVYHVCRERNNHIHQQGQLRIEMITQINKTVKNMITSVCYKCYHPLNGLMRRWFEVI
ncbi:hypothetical protein N665_0068s0014 [Sinapis alba]|nr:hypothetical protein N665_0068s0014 [Sinapis alba]